MPIAKGEGATEIFYEIFGSEGSPVVMCAGMGGSGRFWQPQISALSRRHRVVVYDQVGTGRSSREIDGELSVARMARDVAAVLDAAGIAAVHFVGHAIGGIVGIELAAQLPARVLSLTVVNGWANADAHVRRCFEVRKDILVKSGAQAYLRAQPLFLYTPRWISDNDDHLNAELADQLKTFPSTSVMLARIDMFLQFDAASRLSAVRAPTLIVASRDDALVPHHLSAALVGGIPDSRFETVDSGGHAFTVVHPERFSDLLLAFLQDYHQPAPGSSRVPN